MKTKRVDSIEEFAIHMSLMCDHYLGQGINKPIHLYHYTSNSAKCKMLSRDSVKLKFSRARLFLDKNEGVHILEPFHYACGKLFNSGTIDSDFYSEMKKINCSSVLKAVKEQVWIISFSKNGYSYYMKERYAPADGWILTFNALLADLCLESENDAPRFSLTSVLYSFSKMSKILERLLKKLYSAYCADSNNTKKRLSLCRKCFTNILSSICYSYKSSVYEAEEEVRLIAYLPKNFKAWESEDHRVSLFLSAEDKSENLYLSFDRNLCINETQSPEPVESSRFNTRIMSSKDIAMAYKKATMQIYPK